MAVELSLSIIDGVENKCPSFSLFLTHTHNHPLYIDILKINQLEKRFSESTICMTHACKNKAQYNNEWSVFSCVHCPAMCACIGETRKASKFTENENVGFYLDVLALSRMFFWHVNLVEFMLMRL